jgi:hypothetical protein
MFIEDNDGGGKSVFLTAGDSLAKIPKSHRKLLTPRLREVFADPLAHFQKVADSCPFASMAAWLNALLTGGTWILALHQGDPATLTEAGFLWVSEEVLTAEITPSCGTKFPHQPPALRRYYSLVDGVRWMSFGCAGGLIGCQEYSSLADDFSHYEFHGADIDPAKTFVFGSSSCGDMLIYTEDGRGGWFCHENGKIHLLGTVEDTIQWIYGELLENRSPDFDYNWS